MASKTLTYLFMLSACSPTAVSTDAGPDAPADANEGGTATDAGTFSCPATAPIIGSSCVPFTSPGDGGVSMDLRGLCEFGDDRNIACNALFACEGGKWAQTTLNDAGSTCPTPANATSCPSTFAAVQTGSSCSDTDPNLF